MNTTGGLTKTHINADLRMIIDNFNHDNTATENDEILVVVLNSYRS
jgi:hypothetical protein